MSEKTETNIREEVFKKAFDDMCGSLDKFGPKEILDLLVIHSNNDIIVHQLLLTYPQVVATGQFLANLPTLKPPKQRRDRRGKRRTDSKTLPISP